MGTNAGDAALIGDKVYDAGRGGDVNQLSVEATSILGSDRDFSVNSQMRNLVMQGLIDNNLLPGLVLAEADKLDINHNGTIEVAEGNSLMTTGDMFTQLAAQYMSHATHDVSADDILQAAQYADAKRPDSQPDGIAAVTPAVNSDNSALGDPVEQNPGYYQFADPQPQENFAPDSNDPAAKYLKETQFLGNHFRDLDTDSDNLVSYQEVIDGSQSQSEDTRRAAEIAVGHHLTELNGGSYTSFSMNDVVADMKPHEDAPAGPADNPDLETLKSPSASTEDRLKAIKNLASSGTNTATITDANGQSLNVRMEVIPVAGSGRCLVQMFAIDPGTGKESVVLRAVNDGDTFSHQRDENGQEVDFVGSRWKRNHADSMFSAAGPA